MLVAITILASSLLCLGVFSYLLFLVTVMFVRKKDKRTLPPGPKGAPVLGALPFWKGPETNLQWTKEYGAIYSVKMGSRLNVYLNTIELVTEYLIKQGHLYVDRPSGPAAIAEGILFGSGSHWKLNRKLAGKVTWRDGAEVAFERMFQSELDSLLASLNKAGPLWLSNVLRPYIVNVIVTVLRGHRFADDDPDFDRLLTVLSRLDDVNLLSFSTMASMAFPRAFAKLCPNCPNLPEISRQMQTFVRDWIADSSPAGESGKETVIKEFKESSEYKELTQDDKEMVQSMMDMFFGGVTSTMSAIEYLILYLLHNPKLQSRIQNQVDMVLGKRSPKWEDKDKLPLVEATILETMRLGSVTPSSLPHISVQDTEISGHHVPKGTVVAASLYSLHRDSRFYENPEVFDPDRHINDNDEVIKPKSFLPFGVGPRLCVGDTIVRVGIFMFLTTVMQNFTVAPVEPGKLPPFSSRMRIVRRLEPYQVEFVPRPTDPDVNTSE